MCIKNPKIIASTMDFLKIPKKICLKVDTYWARLSTVKCQTTGASRRCISGGHTYDFTNNSVKRISRFIYLTIRATERQNAAPLAFEAAYPSYSASKNWRSASAIAKSRGSRKSNGMPEIVQPPLQKSIHKWEKMLEHKWFVYTHKKTNKLRDF